MQVDLNQRAAAIWQASYGRPYGRPALVIQLNEDDVASATQRASDPHRLALETEDPLLRLRKLLPHHGRGREMEDAELLMLLASPHAQQLTSSFESELKHWRDEAETWRNLATVRESDRERGIQGPKKKAVSPQTAPKLDAVAVDAQSQMMDRKFLEAALAEEKKARERKETEYARLQVKFERVRTDLVKVLTHQGIANPDPVAADLAAELDGEHVL